MGVIQRQSIKQSLVTYLGIIIGAVSTLFIYPQLELEQAGEIQFIIGLVTFLVPFIGIGLPSVAIHFFPYFKESKEKRGRFLFVISLMTFISLTIFSLLTYFNMHTIGQYSANAYLFLNYLPYILSITFCATFLTLLHAYISNFNRIVVPSIIYNLTLKVLQPILVLIYLFGIITFRNILDGLTIVYITIVFLTIYYLNYLGYLEINFKKIQTEKYLKRSIIDYALFSILINVSASLALQIDKLLVGFMISATAVAIFSVPVLITEAIDVIRKAISGVSAPIVSDSLKNNDINNVNIIYKKSALLQFVIGMFLLIGVWICADDLYQLMPKGKQYSEGKIIILILGLSRLIDMVTGINTEIIAFSKYYRVNLYMLILLSVLTISSNYILIPLFGMYGIALATLISMFFFNAAKLIFIYKKLKIHPFSKTMLWAILIALITLVTALWIPSFSFEFMDNKFLPIITIAIKGIIVTIIYFALLWKFNISEDINKIINNVFKKIFLK